MSNIIAIAFADLHVHKFRNFNDRPISRLDWSLKAFKSIADKAYKLGVPLLFSGDLFHNPKDVENETMGKMQKAYYREIENRGIDFYAISGNHDLSQKNSLSHISPSHLDSFEHFSTFHKLN